jgi:hypothetical protein
VTVEEGTWAAWLYDVLKPHVAELVVCNPRRNALLKEGSKSDKVDARKLAELLRSGMLRAVYPREHGLGTLRELARSYLTGEAPSAKSWECGGKAPATCAGHKAHSETGRPLIMRALTSCRRELNLPKTRLCRRPTSVFTARG